MRKARRGIRTHLAAAVLALSVGCLSWPLPAGGRARHIARTTVAGTQLQNCHAHHMALRGAGETQAHGRSRRARKRRYWRKVAGNQSEDLLAGPTEDCQAPLPKRIRSDRREAADGVQGVLVTTNVLGCKSWRSRASSQTLHLLSNAAQELMGTVVAAVPNANLSNTERGTARHGRKPSKYRLVMEHTGLQRDRLDRGDTTVDAAGQIHRGAVVDTGGAGGGVTFRPMKVDLRGAVFIRMQGLIPAASVGEVGAERGIVDLVTHALERISSAPAAAQGASVWHAKMWRSGEAMAHSHLCRMIPIMQSCYASPQAAAKLAAKLVPAFLHHRPVQTGNSSAPGLENGVAHSFKVELERKCNTGASRDAFISAVAEVSKPPVPLTNTDMHKPARVVCVQPHATKGATCKRRVGDWQVEAKFALLTPGPKLFLTHIYAVQEVLKAEPHATVNLTKPDFIVFVVLMRTACGMSVVDGEAYRRLNQFSLDKIRSTCATTHPVVSSVPDSSEARPQADLERDVGLY